MNFFSWSYYDLSQRSQLPNWFHGILECLQQLKTPFELLWSAQWKKLLVVRTSKYENAQSWERLKLRTLEAENAWSWESSKLRKLEAEKARGWERSKLRPLEAETARSWERSKLRTLKAEKIFRCPHNWQFLPLCSGILWWIHLIDQMMDFCC